MRPHTGRPFQVITYVTHEASGPGYRRIAVDQRVNAGSALCGAVQRLLDIRMLLIEPRARDPEAPLPGQYWCEWHLAPAVGEPDRAYLDNHTGAITLNLAAGAQHWWHRRTAHLEPDHD